MVLNASISDIADEVIKLRREQTPARQGDTLMNRLIPIAVLLFLAVIIADSSLYVVKETERAVKLRFGRLIDTDIQPGLHVKMPLSDDVRKFDSRVMTLDARPESFLTVQKKRLIVDSFAKWRIADVDTYHKATGNEAQAMNRLAKRVNDGLRNEFAPVLCMKWFP